MFSSMNCSSVDTFQLKPVELIVDPLLNFLTWVRRVSSGRLHCGISANIIKGNLMQFRGGKYADEG